MNKIMSLGKSQILLGKSQMLGNSQMLGKSQILLTHIIAFVVCFSLFSLLLDAF